MLSFDVPGIASVGSLRMQPGSMVWAAFITLFLLTQPCRAQDRFQQTNLVSSVSGQAPTVDPNLKNPWGISLSSGSPFWVSNQATGTATLYNGAGQRFPVGNPLVVTVTSIGGTPKGPTGQVFNSTPDFVIPGGGPATFLFANLDGTISAWNPGQGTNTSIQISTGTAVFTGLALGNNGTGNFLYAADRANNRVRAFNGGFTETNLPGNFTDPNLPSGFTAYNVQNIAGTLFVTYENETSGGGVVDAFDLNGNLLRRVSANANGGTLDSPWGLTRAPASFGALGGALLVGNEGNGRISAFDFNTGQLLGQILDAQGNPIANPGLWGLATGNGGDGGSPDIVYFAAGIQNETEGLFGSISAVPEPSTLVLAGAAALTAAAYVLRERLRRSRQPAWKR